MQAKYSMLPFERVPERLVIKMAKAAMLGQDRSHGTRQLLGELQATVLHDQTKCPKPAYEMMVRSERRSYNKQIVHTVMMPMSQPVRGGHMTSMTGQSRLTMTNHMSHNHRDKMIA